MALDYFKYLDVINSTNTWLDYIPVDNSPYQSTTIADLLYENSEKAKETKERLDLFKNACTDKKEEQPMNPNANNFFNNIFGKIAPGMCRLSMNGNIAIKTDSGYKTYNAETGRLTNCSNFAIDIGQDFFFLIPTNKIEKGDIILVDGKPHCVVEVEKNIIKAFRYNDSSIVNVVPEHHMFMGKQFFYGKIISMFGDMGKRGAMNKMMKFMMLSEMMKGSSGNDGGLGSAIPMMLMMNSGENFFEGMFDEEEDEKSNTTEED